jgi:hypothetical protein
MSQPVTMSIEVAEAICNLKRSPDFDTFMGWMSAVADQKQHQLIVSPAETMQVTQGECRAFMVMFNAVEGAEAAREKLIQGNQ